MSGVLRSAAVTVGYKSRIFTSGSACLIGFCGVLVHWFLLTAFARLGWLATLPQTPANFERVCVRPPIEKTFTPDRADTTLHELLAKRYARFRALYQATMPLMVAS